MKSTTQRNEARIVPAIKPINIEIERMKPFVKMFIKRITTIVKIARIKLELIGFGTLLPILPIATGIRLRPIVVITEPVTIGGKRERIFEKTPEIKMTKIPDAMRAPNMAPAP